MPVRKSQARAAGQADSNELSTIEEALKEPLDVFVSKFSEGEPIGSEVILAEAGARVGEGIERELKVIRVGPNPRMVSCEYWELATRRTCVVKVGSNKKWLKGMTFKMREPVSEEEYNKAWEYKGRAPRRKGRW